jgi:hypothetical protein
MNPMKEPKPAATSQEGGRKEVRHADDMTAEEGDILMFQLRQVMACDSK